MRQFFILTGGPDGTHFDGPLGVEELLNRLSPNEHGDAYYGDRNKFLNGVPDLEYMNETEMLIIEGKIVIPQPENVVKTFKV